MRPKRRALREEKTRRGGGAYRMNRLLFGYPMGKNGKKDEGMNVLYQQGLEDVAGELEQMGYRMAPLTRHIPADAVIYVSDAHGALSASAGRGGAPILCVRGMSAGEISAALKRRSVSSLF